MTSDAVRLDHERIVLILHGELTLTERVWLSSLLLFTADISRSVFKDY